MLSRDLNVFITLIVICFGCNAEVDLLSVQDDSTGANLSEIDSINVGGGSGDAEGDDDDDDDDSQPGSGSGDDDDDDSGSGSGSGDDDDDDDDEAEPTTVARPSVRITCEKDSGTFANCDEDMDDARISIRYKDKETCTGGNQNMFAPQLAADEARFECADGADACESDLPVAFDEADQEVPTGNLTMFMMVDTNASGGILESGDAICCKEFTINGENDVTVDGVDLFDLEIDLNSASCTIWL